MLQLCISTAVVSTVLLFVVQKWIDFSYDDREPLRLNSNIPLIGHLLGLLRYGAKYHGMIRYVLRGAQPLVPLCRHCD